MKIDWIGESHIGFHPIFKGERSRHCRGMILQPLDTNLPTGGFSTAGAELSDGDLMCAIQKGDGRALDKLMSRHHGMLKNVILQFVQSDSSADDVLQESLLAIWNRANNYCAAKGSPVSWMITVAKRRAIDSVRRDTSYAGAKNRLEGETRGLVLEQTSNCEDTDMTRVLHDQISLLPEKQREVIRLAFLEGMSQREVAEATHSPLGTVKTRIELALNKLRTTFVRQRMYGNG